MAVLLIYDQIHWMDKPSKDRPDLAGYKNVERKILEKSGLTIEQRTKNLGLNYMNHEAKHQRGDITESREEMGPRGSMEWVSYIFLTVDGLSQKDGVRYTETDGTHRRGYYVNMTGLLPDWDKNVAISLSEFNSRLKAKK